MFNEETQQFAVVDASDGGSPGVGVMICNTTFPVPPFIPIGNSDWSFIQGSEGIMYVLPDHALILLLRLYSVSISLSGGRNLAWSLQATGFGTQVSNFPHLRNSIMEAKRMNLDYSAAFESFRFEAAMDVYRAQPSLS